MRIEDIISVFAPRAAGRMLAYRQAYSDLRSTIGTRRYEAAGYNRLTKGWRATRGSADNELAWDLPTLRDRSRDLVRNNPYATAALRNLVSYMVGTGITARVQHSSKPFARKAQKRWENWCREQGFYQKQKISARSMMESGDCILMWRAHNGVPDARVDVLEGDYIDHTKTEELTGGGRIVQGVEYDADGTRVKLHLFKTHPGDILTGFNVQGQISGWSKGGTNAVDIAYVDHVFETLRPGQTRGVPWFSPVALKLREMEDVAEAIRIKKKIQSSLAVFRTPGLEDEPDSLGKVDKTKPDKPIETIRPGMIVNGKPGETINVVNPSSDGDSDGFRRSEFMSVAAGLGVPFHFLTGDVSNANYTTLRADVVVFHIRLDDWQWNTFIPSVCDPAFERFKRREAAVTGDKRYLDLGVLWTPPARPWVDPYKDAMAEVVLLRAGLSDYADACAARGEDWREKVKQLEEICKAFDEAGLTLDIDPRKVNAAGAFQPKPGTKSDGSLKEGEDA